MSSIAKYRRWFEHERDCNRKMLGMLDTVPVAQRGDPRFDQALVLAAHLAACRENWLDRMTSAGTDQTAWWPEAESLKELQARFAKIEDRWINYLAELTDERLDLDFEFPTSAGQRYRWSIEGQIVQLVGHAFYHRGQIAMLVDQLGGTCEDTDYLYWEFQQQPERWKAVG
jgi:uncharacterized damage-inducible protein DinB